jgi:hypothetical protein
MTRSRLLAMLAASPFAGLLTRIPSGVTNSPLPRVAAWRYVGYGEPGPWGGEWYLSHEIESVARQYGYLIEKLYEGCKETVVVSP